MTTSAITSESADENDRRSAGSKEIDDWVAGYVKRHPMAAVTTVGDQTIL
jgi:phospholipid/cholesterol/gamma-HCH transport system permease protein